jgi:hypothetical protein
MSKKHHGGPAPVPPGNRPQSGPAGSGDEPTIDTDTGEGFQEQDPKRRIGGYETTGEHSRVQPGPLNDGGSTRH